jgi:hypothetical protein
MRKNPMSQAVEYRSQLLLSVSAQEDTATPLTRTAQGTPFLAAHTYGKEKGCPDAS